MLNGGHADQARVALLPVLEEESPLDIPNTPFRGFVGLLRGTQLLFGASTRVHGRGKLHVERLDGF